MDSIDNIKRLVKQVSPELVSALKRCRHSRRFRVAHGGAEYRAKQALVARHGLKIITGPFAGMFYGHDVNCGAYVAKLVGSYEQELHPVIEQIVRSEYRTVVDVGCAEGYYAVGLAWKMQSATVHAFDIDEDARRYCGDLARRNSVAERVRIHGICGPDELASLCGRATLILCDCEGYESELLNPAIVEGLAQTDVLVELHEALCPGVTQILLDRFTPSHDIQLIDTTERDVSNYPQLSNIAVADRPWAVREGRPWSMQWAWMKVKKASLPASALQ